MRTRLSEQTRNRDHDASDEHEQAAKQYNVTQEHTHTLASLCHPERRSDASRTELASLVCCQRRSVQPGTGLMTFPQQWLQARETAATAATCGRTDTLSRRGSPRSHSPRSKAGEGDAVPLFLRTRPGKPQLVINSGHQLWGLQVIGSDYLFLIAKCREPDIGAEHC